MKIFKNKSVIRLYAFVTACLIILTLLLCGLNVCAEELSGPLYSFFEFPSDASDFSSDGLKAPSTWAVENYSYMISKNGFNYDVSNISNFSDTRNYLICAEDGFDIDFYCLPDSAFVIGNSSNTKILIPNDFFTSGKTSWYGHFRGKYYDTTSYFISGSTYWDADSTMTIDGVVYRTKSLNSYVVLSTDCKVSFVSNLNSPTSEELATNINDNYSDVQPGETSENNMYFKNFNISYSVSGLKDGNIVCYGDLNDYQKEHLEEFALTYTFNFEYYVYNPTVSGYKYNFTKNYSYQQTLSDFYSNGSSKVFTLKDIMQNINTQDVDSEYGNLYQLVSYLSNTGNNENIEYIWSKAKMKTTVFIVSASDSPSDILNSSNLHSNSFSKAYNFLDGKSSTYSDGITNNNNPYQTTDTGSITDQNELNNMPDGVSSSNIPSSQGDNGASGTSFVTGDNNIVINNNPTFNNDGSISGSGGGSSDGGVASTFYNTFNPFKTLFSSLNGDNSVISDETADSIGANRFISVMSSTFSFIPEGMWTALTTFFIASLSILVVAVVIRVLLDLL